MRSLKSSLYVIALSGIFGTVAIVGCSADGGGAGIDTEASPTEPGSGSVVPPRGDDTSNTASDGGPTTPKKDGGTTKAEAGVDAGPPPPVEGDACPKLNEIGKKACGACGTAKTVCLDDGTGKGTWSPYGTCEGELVGGCTPGTVVDEACGNCGTTKKTCTQYCAFTSTACTGQPANSCAPGSTDFTTAGCAVASTYRNRQCGETCTWSGYSACETPTTNNKMTAPATVGGVVSAQWSLAGATKRPGTSCPSVISASAATYPYSVVEITNPSATKVAEVTVYQSQSPTGKPNFDLVLWTYNGAALPMTDALLGACANGYEDYCIDGVAVADNICGNTSSNYYFAALDKISIPAGGKILVYSATFSSSPSAATLGDGTFMLNVTTTKLQ
jgi:hypothetical protein